MLLTIFNILFVIIALSMIALILMQRGAGAQAGSGFGGGASATVFGARGSSNFLSKATKWLAISFFSVTMFMAWYAMHRANPNALDMDLGVMSQPAQVPAAPAPSGGVPAAPVGELAPAPGAGAVPEVPVEEENAPAATPEAPQAD